LCDWKLFSVYPCIFEIVLRWAYARFVGAPNPTKTILNAVSNNSLLGAYVFAERVAHEELADAVATCIFFRARKSNTPWHAMGFTKQQFRYYDAWTDAQSTLDELFVDLIMHTQAHSTDARPSTADIAMIPSRFRSISIEHFDRYRERWAKHPQVAKCFYHQHGEDKPCQDGWDTN